MVAIEFRNVGGAAPSACHQRIGIGPDKPSETYEPRYVPVHTVFISIRMTAVSRATCTWIETTAAANSGLILTYVWQVYNYGFSRKELRDIERLARENLETLRNEWDAFCNPDT